MSAVNDMVVGASTAEASGAAVNLSLVKLTTLTQTLLGVAVTSLVVVATVVTVVLIATRAGLVAPIANPDLAITYKAVPVNIYPLINDENPRGDNLTIVSITQPLHGTAELIDGSYVIYKSDMYWSGIDHINYTCINDKLTATSYITIDVRNRIPEPIEQNYIVSKNTRDFEIDIFSYKNAAERTITDPDNDVLSLYNATRSSHGTVSAKGNKLYYTPHYGFNAKDQFDYCVTDFNDTACETINLIVQNDPPVAVQDYYKIKKNSIELFNVLANDYDINFDNLTITSVGNPVQGGALVWEEGLLVRYIPLMSTQTYSDSFEYTIFDGSAFDYSHVIVDVENTPPTAQDITITIHKNTNATLIALPYDDIDALDMLTVAITQPPTIGSYSLIIQSYATFVPLNADFYPKQVNNYTLSYTPKHGIDGVYNESLKYTVTDTISVATGTVTIHVINDAPIAVEDVISCEKNLNVVYDIVANDYDPNGDEIQLVNSNPSTEYLTSEGGFYTILDHSRIQYTPKHGFLGIDTATYQLTDIQQDSSKNLISTGNLKFNVVNTPPVPLDDLYRVPKGFTHCLQVLVNDTDPNGDVVSLLNAGNPSSKTHAQISVENNQQCINYTALNQVYTESWLYTVQDVDNATAQARVTVQSFNIPPVAVNDQVTTSWNQSIIIDVLANDHDENPGDKAALTVVNPLPITQTSVGGTIEIISGKAIKYTPPLSWTGVDTFTYYNNDQIDHSENAATVTVNVVNRAPIANPLEVSAHWGTQITVNLLGIAGNVDPDGDPIVVSYMSGVTNGVVTLNNGGIVTYTPNTHFVGTDSFTYTLSDWLLSSTNTVTIRITNTPPVANPVHIQIHWNSPKMITYVQRLNSDADNDRFFITNLNIPVDFKGVLNITSDSNDVEYTPTTWKGLQQAQYTITDGPATAQNIITVNVTNNHVPEPVPLTYRRHWTSQTLGTSITVLQRQGETDRDGDTLTFTTTQGQHGTVTTDTTTMTFKQSINYLGTDSFSYTIFDGLDYGTAQVNFEIFNHAPVARDYSVARHWAMIRNGIALDTVALCNATDVDTVDFNDQVSLSAVQVVGTSIGSTEQVGNVLTFTPTPGHVATHTYNVEFTDGLSKTNARVAVTVQNTLPVATPVLKTVHWSTQNSGSEFELIPEINDADGDVISLISAQNAKNGTVVQIGNRVRFTQSMQHLGFASFDVTFTDGWQNATATWIVQVVNRAPVARDHSVTVRWTTFTDGTEISVLNGANDADLEDSVSLKSTTFQANHGTAVLEGGKVVYRPTQGYVGTDTFTYTVTDGLLDDTKTVTVNVVDIAPVAVDDYATVHWNTRTVNFPLLSNDWDADNDTIRIKSITSAPKTPASLTIVSNQLPGTVQFALPTTGSDFTLGEYTARYVITDGALDSNEATIHVSVTNQHVINAQDVTESHHWRVAQNGVEISVYNTIRDDDGDTISLSLPTHAHFSTVNKGASTPSVVRYQRASYKGSDTVHYTLSDSMNSTTAQISVSIYNNAPTANDIYQFIPWYYFNTGMEINVISVGKASDIDELDKDHLTVTSITQPTFVGSRVYINETTNRVWINPANDFSGSDTFTYTVSDGLDTVTRTVNVSASYSTPDPSTQFFKIHWSTNVLGSNFKLLENYGQESQQYTLTSILSPPASGAVVSLTSEPIDNSLNYRQNAVFLGTDNVEVRVVNALAAEAVITAIIEVYNNPPVTVAKSASIHWSSTANLNLLTGSSDPDGVLDTVQLGSIRNPNHGTVTPVTGSSSNVIYTPTGGFVGTDRFNFDVTDGSLSDTKTATITMVNNPPVPSPKSYEFHWKAYSAGVTVDVLTGDVDPDTATFGDIIRLVSVGQPSDATAGTATRNGNQVNLKGPTVNPYYGKTFTFSYTETDGAINGQVTATVPVTVNNRAPVAVADSLNIHWRAANVPVNVLTNDYDPDTEDTPFVTGASSSVGASVTVTGQNTVNYTPRSQFTGTDVVTYQLTDGAMSASPAGRLTVTVYNNAPTAKSYTVTKHWFDAKNNGFMFDVIADATESDSADVTHLAIVNTPVSSQGTITLVGNNKQIRFVPNNGFTGTVTFTYTITDGLATASNTIRITVTDAAPTATPFNTRTHWRTPTAGIAINITDSLSDSDNDAVIVSAVNSPTANGIATLNGNIITYKQNVGFVGTDSFTITYSDTWLPPATATYSVTIFNNAPVVRPLTTIMHSSTYAAGATVNVIANSDVSLRPTDADTQDASHLTVSTVSGTFTGTASITSGTTLRYIPRQHQLGDNIITYTVTDGLASASSTWTVTVYNNAPTNSDYSDSVHWSTCATTGIDFTVSTHANDPDVQDSGKLTFNPTTNPSFGTVTITSTGVFKYTCTPGTGRITDSFQFTTSDGTLSAVNTVTIRVLNGIPIARNNEYNRHWKQVNFVADVYNNDEDPDQDQINIVPSSLSSPTGAGASISVSSNPRGISYNMASITPAKLGVADTFTYRVTDTIDQSTAASVSVTLYNNPPTAQSYSRELLWHQSDTTNLVCTDPDVGLDTATFQGITQQPVAGTITVLNVANKQIRYTPASAAPNTGTYRVTYTAAYACTDGLLSGTASLTYIVSNTQPTSSSKSTTISRNYQQPTRSFDGLLNQPTDADGDTIRVSNLQLSASSITGTSTSWSPTNTQFTVTTPANFVGTKQITWQVFDGQLYSPTYTYTIIYTNAAPICGDLTIPITKNDQAVFDNIAATCSDANNDPLTFITPTSVPFGSITTRSGPIVTYTPAQRRSGTITTQYTVNDGATGSTTNTLTIIVNNRAPVAMPASYTFSGSYANNAVFSISTYIADSGSNDPDNGDSISIVSATGGTCNQASTGSTTVSNGVIQFTNFDSSKYDFTCTVTVTITDNDQNNPLTSTATVTIRIVAPSPPIANDDLYTVPQSTPLLQIPTGVTTWTAPGGRVYDGLMLNDIAPQGTSIVFDRLLPCTSGYCRQTPTVNSAGTFVNYPVDSTSCVQDRFQYRIRTNTVNPLYATATATIRFTNCYCRSALDIYFVIDSSGSIGQANFNTQRQFLINLTGNFDISPTGINIGVVQFGRDGYVYQSLSSQATAVRNTLTNLPYLAGDTHTLAGISTAIADITGVFPNNGTTRTARGRVDVPKVLVVVTDGCSNAPCSCATVRTSPVMTCQRFYSTTASRPSQCSSPHYPGRDCSHCDYTAFYNQYQSGSQAQTGCMPCADPLKLTDQINSWTVNEAGQTNSPHSKFPIWKVIAMGVGDLINNTFGRSQIVGMNYDHNPDNMILVSWSNLQNAVNTIVDAACNT